MSAYDIIKSDDTSDVEFTDTLVEEGKLSIMFQEHTCSTRIIQVFELWGLKLGSLVLARLRLLK